MPRFISFWLYPPLAVALLTVAWTAEPAWTPIEAAGLWSAGLLGWTLLEYVLHRWIFHRRFRNSTLEQARQEAHILHHKHPRDPGHLLVKPRNSLSASALIGAALWALSGSAFVASAVLAGLWTGFLYYESVHYRLHLSKRTGFALKFQRSWHFHHHFVDGEVCFGVTSPLWDYLLGTARGTRS